MSHNPGSHIINQQLMADYWETNSQRKSFLEPLNPYHPQSCELTQISGTNLGTESNVLTGTCNHYPVVGSIFILDLDDNVYSLRTSTVTEVTVNEEERSILFKTRNSVYNLKFI